MRAILKQSSWLFMAQAVARIISFFYIIFLARSLGVDDFGLYTVALAYFSIISAFADFGFNRFLIREVAKDKAAAPDLICNIVILRLAITSIFFAIFSLILYLFDPDKMRVSLTLLATLAILPQSVALTLDGVFIAIQKLKISGLTILFTGFSTAFLGFFLVSAGFGAFGGVNALLLGQMIYVGILIIVLRKNKILKLTHVNKETIKKVILGSLPYGMLGVLGLLYFRIDTILLSYLRGSFETGIYSAGYKFLEAVTFIPAGFSAALFPVLSRLHIHDKDSIAKLYFKSLKVMLGFGIVTLLAFILILPTVIRVFLPNYISSISVVLILSLSIPFMFAHVPAVSVLFSTEKYLKKILTLSVITLLFNIVLNLILIPQYGFIGAAWVTLASEVLSFVLFFIFLRIRVFR